MPKSQALKSTKSYRNQSVSARRSLLFVLPGKVSREGRSGDLLSSDKGDPCLPGVSHISVIIREILPLILTHDTLRRRYRGEVD